MEVEDLGKDKAMPFRHKISGRKSRKMFSKHADKTHRRNMPGVPRGGPMRGGIRL